MTEPGAGHPAFYAYADELHERHRLKSGGYGTGADPFANFTAIASVSGRRRWEYPVERIIEKCTRIQSLTAQGRFDELREEFRDVGGLAGCCDAMLEDDHYARRGIQGQQGRVIAVDELADVPASHDGMAPMVGAGPRNYLRLTPELERERRWMLDGGVGLTD